MARPADMRGSGSPVRSNVLSGQPPRFGRARRVHRSVRNPVPFGTASATLACIPAAREQQVTVSNGAALRPWAQVAPPHASDLHRPFDDRRTAAKCLARVAQ
jgi:hypothetical protein